MQIPVEWAFGSGGHGVTFVSRLAQNSYLEHAFSYYERARALDLTPGQKSLPARTLVEAAGRLFRGEGPRPTIRGCFQCHSTGPVAISARREVEIREQGIRCEACHGSGRRHVESAARGEKEQVRRTILNPGSMSPGKADQPLRLVSQACGRRGNGERFQ